MIARLEGVLHEVAPTRAVVDVGGVGYELHIPLSTFSELPDPGKTVVLQVHTHAREGSLQLFGFHSAAERAAFELLLRASRVGPRLAQSVLSGIAPEELSRAIREGNTAALRAVPGIGPKMAERMLVELRDRVGELDAVLSRSRPGPPGAAAGPVAAPGLRDQALSALQNLGYPKPQAERVLLAAEEAVGPDAGLEPLLRAALKRLAG